MKHSVEYFADRTESGIILADLLKKYDKDPAAIVLALPRGGVPVAFEIARALSLPLDVFIVRKLGVPGHKELAMGAIATQGTLVFNDNLLRSLRLSQETIDQVVYKEQRELKRKELLYRGDKPFPVLKDKKIILVDDGIATGASMRAAVKSLVQFTPAKIILAIPVAAEDSYEELARQVDEIICPLIPKEFSAVRLWYRDFPQTSDSEVIELLMK